MPYLQAWIERPDKVKKHGPSVTRQPDALNGCTQNVLPKAESMHSTQVHMEQSPRQITRLATKQVFINLGRWKSYQASLLTMTARNSNRKETGKFTTIRRWNSSLLTMTARTGDLKCLETNADGSTTHRHCRGRARSSAEGRSVRKGSGRPLALSLEESKRANEAQGEHGEAKTAVGTSDTETNETERSPKPSFCATGRRA